MNEFTKENLQELITILKNDVPLTGSEYCMGYQMPLMLIQRWLDGKNPFVIEVGGIRISRDE